MAESKKPTRKPRLDTPVTFKLKEGQHHTHRGEKYYDGDVALVDKNAVNKLERKNVAVPGGEPKKAKNVRQADEVNRAAG